MPLNKPSSARYTITRIPLCPLKQTLVRAIADSCTVVKELVRVPQLIDFARLFPMSHLTAQSSWALSWELLFAFRAS
jgi:hypothetical protein